MIGSLTFTRDDGAKFTFSAVLPSGITGFCE